MDPLARKARVAVTTTMIAALAAVEEHFPEAVETDAWQDVRSIVLSRGNSQLRGLLAEIDAYRRPAA